VRTLRLLHHHDRRVEYDTTHAKDLTQVWTSPWREITPVAGAHRDREKVVQIGNGVKDARWELYAADTRMRAQSKYSASTPRASAATRRPRRPLSPIET